MPETLAAALLKHAGYREDQKLCDPFCGTGTILIEAAYIATHTPAGFLRKTWGFMHMREHDANKWENFKRVFDQKRIPLEKGVIFGADKDLSELSLCRAHLAKLGFIEQIELAHKEVFSYVPPRTPTLIVTDPPLGKRLQSSNKIYEDFGLFLGRLEVKPKVFVLAQSAEALQPTGHSIASPHPISHGGMDMFLFELG